MGVNNRAGRRLLLQADRATEGRPRGRAGRAGRGGGHYWIKGCNGGRGGRPECMVEDEEEADMPGSGKQRPLLEIYQDCVRIDRRDDEGRRRLRSNGPFKLFSCRIRTRLLPRRGNANKEEEEEEEEEMGLAYSLLQRREKKRENGNKEEEEEEEEETKREKKREKKRGNNANKEKEEEEEIRREKKREKKRGNNANKEEEEEEEEKEIRREKRYNDNKEEEEEEEREETRREKKRDNANKEEEEETMLAPLLVQRRKKKRGESEQKMSNFQEEDCPWKQISPPISCFTRRRRKKEEEKENAVEEEEIRLAPPLVQRRKRKRVESEEKMSHFRQRTNCPWRQTNPPLSCFTRRRRRRKEEEEEEEENVEEGEEKGVGYLLEGSSVTEEETARGNPLPILSSRMALDRRIEEDKLEREETSGEMLSSLEEKISTEIDGLPKEGRGDRNGEERWAVEVAAEENKSQERNGFYLPSDSSSVSGKRENKVSSLPLALSRGRRSVKKGCSKARKFNLDKLMCYRCHRGDGEPDMLLCDECDRGFHTYCLCPILVRIPKGPWFCPLCTKKDRISEFPLVQKKIVDFFRIQRPLLVSPDGKKKKRHSLCLHKKSRKLLPHVPSKNPLQRLKQMASLATALTSLGMEFSDELTYMPGLAPKSANRAYIERGGVQVMGKEDKATLELCKQMCGKGEWPPLMVTHDPRQGFVVEADAHIKDMTLIAEYTGDVDYMVKRQNDESDSIMALICSDNPSKELVICPDKRGNIARFISGINNHTIEGRKKQNLRCARYNVDGRVCVLLVAIRDICKGEQLYYDYNAFHKEYPTQHFV